MPETTIGVSCPSLSKTYNIQIDLTSKVRELILELAQILIVKETEYISLIFGKQIMNPEKTFQDYGIKKGDNIELVVKAISG